MDKTPSSTLLVENPLVLGDQKIVPYLKAMVNPEEWSELGFYFIAAATRLDHTAAGEEQPQVDLIISKDGKPIGHLGEKPLPPPDEQGQIRYLARLPIANFSQGI